MAKSSATRTYGVALPVALRRRILALIAERGEAPTARAFGVSRPTLARCAAGLMVQKSTAECVSRRLPDVEAGKVAT